MNHNYETPGKIMGGPDERYAPKFITMEEIQAWFDRNYCGIDKVVIIPPMTRPPSPEFTQHRMAAIADAAAPAATRKVEWLRRDGNEEWYGPRLAIVHAVWNELKARHESVVDDLSDRQRKLDQELVKANQALRELREEGMALSEQNHQLKRDIGVVRNVIMSVLAGFRNRRMRVGNVIKNVKTWNSNASDAVKSFRELLAKELKP